MSTEKRLGNLWGATGGSFAGMVYDSKYLAPSITTAQGGGADSPMWWLRRYAMEFVKNIHARVWKWDENHTSRPISEARIIDIGSTVAWGVLARYYKGFCGTGESCVIVQNRRERRTAGLPTEQRLEIRCGAKCCSCLTSVRKDNLILEVNYETHHAWSTDS